MRYSWAGGLVAIAILGAACSGGGGTLTSTTVHHHRKYHHAHRPKTKVTTPPVSTATTVPKLASGPRDLQACNSFSSLGRDAGRSRRVIGADLRQLFREFRRAENRTMRRDGHEAAKALLKDNRSGVKSGFSSIFLLCTSME